MQFKLIKIQNFYFFYISLNIGVIIKVVWWLSFLRGFIFNSLLVILPNNLLLTMSKLFETLIAVLLIMMVAHAQLPKCPLQNALQLSQGTFFAIKTPSQYLLKETYHSAKELIFSVIITPSALLLHVLLA